MLDESNADWRASRRAAASERILAEAWAAAREHGLAALSLRDLARRLGMAAPSLYSYFDSKHGLYDAMYADGWQTLLALQLPEPGPD
ncbi:MAG: TetR/AcrR family transcriptional regulator, partial [Actinomycetota bacterium]|nr:TetR/AcrR family transcriptional regulator [Actinomycetota bacterium]